VIEYLAKPGDIWKAKSGTTHIIHTTCETREMLAATQTDVLLAAQTKEVHVGLSPCGAVFGHDSSQFVLPVAAHPRPEGQPACPTCRKYAQDHDL
jgi:hypothetical protein